MKTLNELAPALRAQRKRLGLNQTDMHLRTGMRQQQYQRIETGSDPRLSTLLRLLEGMELELMLVPRAQVSDVEALLAGEGAAHSWPAAASAPAGQVREAWQELDELRDEDLS